VKSAIFNSVASAALGGSIVGQATLGDWDAVAMLAFALFAWAFSCAADAKRGL